MQDDAQLLRQFVKERSQTAFAELVRKYIDLVYSAACRIVRGDVHRVEDICQEAFTTLARKAPLLTDHPVLVGWLHTTTRHAALRLVRAEKPRGTGKNSAVVSAGTGRLVLKEPKGSGLCVGSRERVSMEPERRAVSANGQKTSTAVGHPSGAVGCFAF